MLESRRLIGLTEYGEMYGVEKDKWMDITR